VAWAKGGETEGKKMGNRGEKRGKSGERRVEKGGRKREKGGGEKEKEGEREGTRVGEGKMRWEIGNEDGRVATRMG